MLTNLEVWHSLSSSQIEILEKIDTNFLKKVLKSHSKTPTEALYLETGLLQIRYVAIQRRLMYLHNILKKPENELIRKVYEIQNRYQQRMIGIRWYRRIKTSWG